MAGPPGPRDARPEGKLHDPAIHFKVLRSRGMDGVRTLPLLTKGGHDMKSYPNRPVMYCSVRLFSGAVKIFSVAPYSTSSPRYMKAV
jgi:hypothetical protein